MTNPLPQASRIFYCHLYVHTMHSDLTLICETRARMLRCESLIANYDGPVFDPVHQTEFQTILRMYDKLTRTLYQLESRQLDRDFPTDVPF